MIIVELNKSTEPLSVNAIAERCGMSYTTAKKYLDSLLKKNLILGLKPNEEEDYYLETVE